MNILKIPKTIITRSAAATQKLGQELAGALNAGDIVCLIGGLGAGKTCLVQGICRGLKVPEYVNSPTFKIVNEYRGRVPVYHFDLYRLDNRAQIEGLGYEEYLCGGGITLIEWAEKIIPYLPETYLEISLTRVTENARRIRLRDRRSQR
jgi:tRNA threonylcarbamoyladenosine biosynthesis protein TsaE